MEECNICFHDLDKVSAWRCEKCGQICHQFCIDSWREQRQVCPFCIQDISNSEIVYNSESEETNITIHDETMPIVQDNRVVINNDDGVELRKSIAYVCLVNILCIMIVCIYIVLYVYYQI